MEQGIRFRAGRKTSEAARPAAAVTAGDGGDEKAEAAAATDAADFDRLESEAYQALWRAPELLRADEEAAARRAAAAGAKSAAAATSSAARGTVKGDVYAFGVILYEIYGRSGPYGDMRDNMSYQEIISRVRRPSGIELMRPDLELLGEREDDVDYTCPHYVIGKRGISAIKPYPPGNRLSINL